MTVQFLTTPEQCALAAAKLRARKAVAIDRLEIIEREHQQRMIDYIQNRITDAELDEIQLEKARLQILRDEDHSALHQKLMDRRDQLLNQATSKRHALEQYQRRVRFSEIYNAIINGTGDINVQTLRDLEQLRPGDLPGDQWWRFSTHLGEYSCLPVNGRKLYGEFCRCPEYVPEPLEK